MRRSGGRRVARPSRARCPPSVEMCCSLLHSWPMEVRARNMEEEKKEGEGRGVGKERDISCLLEWQ